MSPFGPAQSCVPPGESVALVKDRSGRRGWFYCVAKMPEKGELMDRERTHEKAEDSATGIIQAFADDSRDDSESAFCFAYDYIYMVISHSAATLLRLGTIEISGVDSPVSKGNARARSGRIDRSAAMRYCGMAITLLVEMNRSANFFPCDMAGNLSQIAQETGMVLADWVSDSVVKATEARAAPPESVKGVSIKIEADGQKRGECFCHRQQWSTVPRCEYIWRHGHVPPTRLLR